MLRSLLLLVAGCTSLRARTEFANEHHCGVDDVTATPRGREHYHLSGCGAEADWDCRSLPCVSARRAKPEITQATTLPAAPELVDFAPLDKAKAGDIRRCYEQAWKTNPGLTGTFYVEFTIGKDGAVTHAKVARSTLNDSTVEACVTKRVSAVVFGKRGEPANVSVPFAVRP